MTRWIAAALLASGFAEARFVAKPDAAPVGDKRTTFELSGGTFKPAK